MPTKLTGKAFKISEDDARSYRYAKPMRSNPGVTHIAAINGPGAYARKTSARQAMAGATTKAERAARARQALPKARSATMEYYGRNPRKRATPAQMAARKRFAEMARSGALKRMRSNVSNSGRSKSASRSAMAPRIVPMPMKVIRSAPRGQASLRPLVSTGHGGIRPMDKPPKLSTRKGAFGVAPRVKSAPVAQRSAGTQAAIERAIKLIEAGKYPIGKGISAAVRAEAYRILGQSPKRRSVKRKSTPAAAGAKKGSKSMAKRKSRKAAAKKGAEKKATKRRSAKKGARKAAKKGAAKKSSKRRSRKAAAKKAAKTRAAKKAARSRSAKKAAKTRAAKKRGSKKGARKAAKRRSAKKGARKAAKRRSAKKGARKTAKRRSSKRGRSVNMMKAHAALRRKYGWKGMSTLAQEGWIPPKKRKSRKGKKGKKGYRKNSMRRNEMGSAIVSALKIGATITGGFIAHKAVAHVLNTIVFDRFLTPAVAEAAAESAAEEATATEAPAEAAKAASGVGEIAAIMRSTVGGGVAALAGVMLTNLLIKDQETKQLIAGGVVASFVHGLLVSALEGLVPDVVPMLSGDGSAARLSAMMGIGASIEPRYAPIDGYGEYLTEGTSGIGEYFESGTAGLGNYTGNPDIYEAAAGYGSIYEAAAGYGTTNHINPSSNLDHELTMAEAAAGIGASLYEAAAGIGEYFEGPVSGFGDVAALPGVDTSIPGGQLWAGVKEVDEGQSETAMVPAGILETGGGSGIFG